MSNAFPILGILIAAGAFIWYVNPTWSVRVPELQGQLAEIDRALGSADAFEDKLATYEEQISRIPEEKLLRLEKLVPNAVDNVRIILDIGGVAEQVGIVIADIDVSPTPEGSTGTGAVVPPPGAAPSPQSIVFGTSEYQSLTVTLTANGSYQSVKDFLSVLERSLRLIDVTSFELRRNDAGVFSLALAFKVYWLTPQQ